MKRQVLQFSEPLKQAILDGYKVQTRRIVKPQPTQPTTIWYADASDSGKWVAMGPSRKGSAELRKTSSWISCPYGKSGESILLADESGTPFASAVVVGVRIQRLQSLSEADRPTPAPRARWRSIIRRRCCLACPCRPPSRSIGANATAPMPGRPTPGSG